MKTIKARVGKKPCRKPFSAGDESAIGSRNGRAVDKA
jgi:hypothetical protein